MDSLDRDRDSRLEKNDDISIIDLIITLLKYKWLILSIVIITMTATISFLLITTGDSEKAVPTQEPAAQNLYYSECVIQPYALPTDMVFTILHRTHASVELLEKTEIYSILYPDLWDTVNRRWKTSTPPSQRNTYNLLRPNLGLFVSGNLFTIGYISNNPEIPQKIVNCYITGLSEYLRQKDKDLIKSKIDLLTQQLRLESDLLVKKNLSSEIIQLRYAELRLNDKYYGFSVIDYPFPTWKPNAIQVAHIKQMIKDIEDKIEDTYKKKYETTKKPVVTAKRTSGKMIVLLMAFASLAFAVFLVFLIEYFNSMKENRPAQYVLLRSYLPFSAKRKANDQK